MSDKRLNHLKESFELFTPQMMDLYKPWTHEEPIMIDKARIELMQSAQMAMLKLMTHIAEHYTEICHLLPHDDRIKKYLSALQGISFQSGTFRTDFVVNEDNELRLIEVTCRYPLNGYFRSPAMNKLCDAQVYSAKEGLSVTEMQMPLLEKFLNWMGDTKHICIIQGEDNRGNESLHLPKILTDAGIEVRHIGLTQWQDDWQQHTADSAIIAELDFEEWLSLPTDMVRCMMQQPLLNDPRLVFTVHDKGFFALINEDKLVNQILTNSEIAILRQTFAETYLPEQSPNSWLDAIDNPSRWMLKSRKLGRSVDISAGCLASNDDWSSAVRSSSKNGMILQRWYQSKKVTGSIADKKYSDYFAGTLLYWGSDFFGPGMFRMSSHPISNVVDDRKATFIVDVEHSRLTHPHLNWL